MVKVRSRSLKTAPFDKSHTSSYSPSIVTIAPSQGGPRRNFVKMFDADKTRMIELPYGEKKLWQYVKSFSSNTGT